MNILQRGVRFVELLRSADDGRRCVHCGYRITKKHGRYVRTVRLLGGAQRVAVQRYWCHRCRRSYAARDRRWARGMRYGREVHRKALDMYFHVGASLRCVAEWLRGEVAPGAGRSRHWRPWTGSADPDQPGARLSHVSIWRWGMVAGRRARRSRVEQAWAGVVEFCGAVVADATAVCIRGVWHSVHTINDAVSRVNMQLERLAEAGEAYLAGRFRMWLATWGIAWQQVRVLVTDGAGVYYGVLNMVLRQTRQQRCLFHLWRNLLPDIRSYAARTEPVAGLFVRFTLKALFAAASLKEAYGCLEDVERTFRHVPDLAGVLRNVRRTLPELWAVVEATAGAIERTNGVAERFFRRLKQRTRRMGNFMSPEGADCFLEAWSVYINFEPYQVRRERKRRYRYPGQCPLAIGQANVEGLCWLDALEI